MTERNILGVRTLEVNGTLKKTLALLKKETFKRFETAKYSRREKYHENI
jgi:hypothetical protein